VTKGGEEARIRVFLLDDHGMVRRGLKDRFALEPDIEVVGEAATAREALAMLLALRPDVAVLDVQLPDGDGVSVCREIRSAAPEIACLMLTGHTGDQALIGAIMAGAAGYIRKDNYAETLVSAVRTVAAGESVLDAHAAAIALDLVRERLAHRTGQELSTQEKRILELIGQGLTDQVIAQRLGVPQRAAKAQARALLGKLGLLATQAAGVGGGLAG
jgi:DNA-binding NarL/FixJ family response regulator